jgi:hypothetical protein
LLYIDPEPTLYSCVGLISKTSPQKGEDIFQSSLKYYTAGNCFPHVGAEKVLGVVIQAVIKPLFTPTVHSNDEKNISLVSSTMQVHRLATNVTPRRKRKFYFSHL